MIRILTRIATIVLIVVLNISQSFASEIEVTCAASGSADQDDMCIWVHPENPALSTIITSDKDNSILFVYTLAGETLYSYPLPMKPGNIDIIYNFPFDGELIDVVGFNERTTSDARFVFYKVNKQTGELSSLGAPLTTESWSNELYGFCLYKSPKNNEYYAFGCDESSMIQQYRLFDDGSGNLVLEHKRTWQNGSNGPTEGMVADHEKGLLYAGNEEQGIYVYHADEDMTTDHLRFLPVKNDTLAADVEGLAIYYAANGQGYLLASSQGQNYFSVFERDGDNAFVRKFNITGVGDTDGIDVLNVSLNNTFPLGIFACHNDNVSPHPVNLVKWEDIADDNSPDLLIDTTYWNPREAMLTEIGQNYYENEIACSVYPNPFSRQTKICLDLPAASVTKCVIYDVMGKMVNVIFDGILQAGKHEFYWQINNSLKENTIGIFYCHIMVDGKVFIKKLICVV
jgi:3-phytase